MKTYNEDKYDEELREQGITPPDSWQGTPKGLLAAALMKKYQENVNDDIGGTDKETLFTIVDEVWSDYEQWCRTHFGKGSNVSGIIFDIAGGRFAELPTEPPEEEDDLLN